MINVNYLNKIPLYDATGNDFDLNQMKKHTHARMYTHTQKWNPASFIKIRKNRIKNKHAVGPVHLTSVIRNNQT